MQQKCLPIEREVLAAGRIPLDELEAEKPGGANNTDQSAAGWVWYYGELRAMQRAGGVVAMSAADRWNEQTINDLRASLFEEPVYITLESATRNKRARTVGVYPKGEVALNHLQLLDASMRWLAPQLVCIADAPASAAQLEAYRGAIEAKETLMRQYVWILTHPGPDVPWEDDGTFEHDPPLWTRGVTTFDFLAIRRAHLEVNYARLNSVAEATHVPGHAANSALPWEAFAGMMAKDAGISPREFVRKHSKGAAYAMAGIAFFAQAEADAKAKVAA